MPWKKGETGNAAGRPKGVADSRRLTSALRMRLMADPGLAKRIANKLLTMAEDGNIEAAKLIFERLEGKADLNLSVEHWGSIEHAHDITPDERRARVRELTTKPLFVLAS